MRGEGTAGHVRGRELTRVLASAGAAPRPPTRVQHARGGRPAQPPRGGTAAAAAARRGGTCPHQRGVRAPASTPSLSPPRGVWRTGPREQRCVLNPEGGGCTTDTPTPPPPDPSKRPSVAVSLPTPTALAWPGLAGVRDQ